VSDHSHLRNFGISKNLEKVSDIIKCPRCGFEFRLMYARAFACQGCKLAVTGCEYVRCPKCDLEFPISHTKLTQDGTTSESISSYMSKVVSDYFRDFGENPAR